MFFSSYASLNLPRTFLLRGSSKTHRLPEIGSVHAQWTATRSHRNPAEHKYTVRTTQRIKYAVLIEYLIESNSILHQPKIGEWRPDFWPGKDSHTPGSSVSICCPLFSLVVIKKATINVPVSASQPHRFVHNPDELIPRRLWTTFLDGFCEWISWNQVETFHNSCGDLQLFFCREKNYLGKPSRKERKKEGKREGKKEEQTVFPEGDLETKHDDEQSEKVSFEIKSCWGFF